MTNEGPNGRRLSEEYSGRKSRVLGEGMSGAVVTTQHRRSGIEYALKTLWFDDIDPDVDALRMSELRLEIEAHRRLDHPNIVRLYETYEDEEGIHMILELCTGGNLVERVQACPAGLPEQEAARLISTMLSALVHCHEHDIVHRDIKLDNFVYTSEAEDAELKLIDFGLAHLGRPGAAITARGRVGTLSYMAPEVVQRKPYAKACDMWSLGVTAYLLLTGRRPFHDADREAKMAKILHAEPDYSSAVWRKLSPAAATFVQRLLRKRPSARMTARQALRDPWLLQYGRGQSLPSPAVAIQPVVRSLQAFSTSTRFHKVASQLLAFAAPAHEIERLTRVFQAIDADGSGAISLAEFHDAMAAAHPEFSELELRRLFDHLKLSVGPVGAESLDAELSYNEFVAATIRALMGPPEEEELRVVFERLDTDHDDVVSRADVLRALGEAVEPSEVDTMFDQLGCASGKLFFADLLRLMRAEPPSERRSGLAPQAARFGGMRRSLSLASLPTGVRRGAELSESCSSSVASPTDEEVIVFQPHVQPPWLGRARSAQVLVKGTTAHGHAGGAHGAAATAEMTMSAESSIASVGAPSSCPASRPGSCPDSPTPQRGARRPSVDGGDVLWVGASYGWVA